MDINQLKANVFPGESGGDYNALFGYSNRPSGQFEGVNLTDMTVNEALQFASPSGPYAQWVKGQVGRVATPMGAYQVVGTTLRSAKEGLGLTGNERMTPEVQDQIGQWIYQTQGPGAWEAWGNGRSGSTNMARQPQPVSGMAAQGQASSQTEEEKVPFFRRPAVGNALDSLAIALQGMTLNPNEGLIQLSAGRIADRREAAQTAQQRNRTVEALKQMGADQQLIQLAESGYADAALKEALRMRRGEKPKPYTDIAKLNADFQSGLITPEQYEQQAQGLGGGDLSAKEKRISRLQETGLDRSTAIGIADGRLAVSRNPDTGRAEIIDKATGGIVSQNVPTEIEQAASELPESDILEGANVRGALGAQGLGASALNAITDAIGAGQAAPEIGRAQQALSNLSTRTMLALSAEFPGRPSNLTREKIEEMTVKPGELSTGPQSAFNKATEMRRTVQQAYDAAQRAASGSGGFSAQQRNQARASLADLEPLLSDYIALENSLRPQSSGTTIRPDVADRLEAYQ